MKVTNTAYVNMEVDFKSLSDQLLKQLQTKGINVVIFVFLFILLFHYFFIITIS